MKVVLDSNIIVADFRMSGSNFRILTEWLPHTEHSVHVPQLVIDEVVNQFKSKLLRENDKVKSSLTRIEKMTGDEYPWPLDEARLNAALDAYRQGLHQKLRGLGASVLPYPNIDHPTLVERDLARRKPFSESGAGYRDALIWESALDVAAQDDTPVAFVTNNISDFADLAGALHPDLVQDLLRRGFEPGRVVLFRDLSAFVDQHVKPTMERLTDIEVQLQQGTYSGFDLAEEIGLKIQDEYATKEWSPGQVGLSEECEDPTIDMVGPVHHLQVEEVRHLGEGEVLVSLVMDADVEFTFFVARYNLPLLDEEDMRHIHDYNWNEWVSRGSISKAVRMYIDLTIDTEEDDITSLTINDLYPPEWDEA